MNTSLRTTRITPSSIDGLLSRLGIRPEEQQVTLLLFSNIFFGGLTVGMIRVCAYTLFLAHFESQQLALIAILLAVVGTGATLSINWLTRHLSVRGYIYTILAVLLTGLLGFRLFLANSHSSNLIFFLPLWFEVAYMLISLQFTALISRLFNVRQAKRLAGITRSGEFLAEILGGLSVVFLLSLIEVEDLLLVAFISTVCVFLSVQKTAASFKSKLQLTTEDIAATEAKGGQLPSLLKQPYVRLISVCYALYIFAYFFLDVTFYDLASRQFPDQRELAAFLGQFFATTGFLTLLSLAFVFAPFLKRFGILGGLISFPAIIATGSLLVAVFDLADLPIAIIFGAMVLTNGFRFVLQSSIWRPCIAILFQVMPDQSKHKSNTLIEGIVDPLSGGIAGISLFCLTVFLGWKSMPLLLLLAALLTIWVACSFMIRKMYLSNLVLTLQKRKLGELTLSELDRKSLEIIERRLESEHPAEVLYCLDLLEGLHHEHLSDLLCNVLNHQSTTVRMDALRRIERLRLDSTSQQVARLFDTELDVEVLGQAFVTYGTLGSKDTIEILKPFLQIRTHHLHKGALVGILRFDSSNTDAIHHLTSLAQASDVEDRKFAATVVGELGDKAYSNLLRELLNDSNIEAVQQALIATDKIDDDLLVPPIVAKLRQLKLQPLATRILKRKGEIALPELEKALSSAALNDRERFLIINIIGEIGTPQGIRILCSLATQESPEIKHRVYVALANLHYQAEDHDKYIYASLVEEEVSLIAWLLAAMADLDNSDSYEFIQRALATELDQHRDNMLLLISFLYTSVVMLDTRANIDSKVADLRIFSLEVLDNILNTEIKQIVLPILEELSVSEKLEILRMKFPQVRYSAEDRLDNVIMGHYSGASDWTRACLLLQIGKDRMLQHSTVVSDALQNPKPLVRETALWAYACLAPDGLENTLQEMAQDTAPNIGALAELLLQNNPAAALLTES